MNNHHCCTVTKLALDNARPPASRLRRGGELAGWIVPSATLALLPKCPACVVAYVALFSGVGISVSTATYLRTSLLVLCGTALLFLSLKRLCRMVAGYQAAARHSHASGTKSINQYTNNL